MRTGDGADGPLANQRRVLTGGLRDDHAIVYADAASSSVYVHRVAHFEAQHEFSQFEVVRAALDVLLAVDLRRK